MLPRTFSTTYIILALLLSCNCAEDKKALEVSPCGICPDKKMRCISNECQCPEGYYMFGTFCEEKTVDSYTATFDNSPFECKKSGTLIMPELQVDFSDMYDFGIFFSDGTVGQSTDARYYKNPEYELVSDEYFWLPASDEGICDSNGVFQARVVAKRNIGSNEVSVFFEAYRESIDDVVDTFTVVFRN